MNEVSALNLIALPILFGLFGFVEPCSIGSTLVMIKQIEQRTPAQQIIQTLVFAVTRALFIGSAGLLAAASDRSSWAFRRRPGCCWASCTSAWVSFT